MAFFLRFPTLPAGFVSKLLFPLRKQRYYPMHSNYKANMRHLKILSIPHVFEIVETISPTISRPVLASSIPSTAGMKTVIVKVTTARSQPAAGALPSVGAAAHPKFNRPVLQVVLADEAKNAAQGEGVPTIPLFCPFPKPRGLALQRNVDKS